MISYTSRENPDIMRTERLSPDGAQALCVSPTEPTYYTYNTKKMPPQQDM